MTRALIVGRFQPFHLGHLAVVEHAAETYDEVVLAVGSAEESHSLENPFTAGERVAMIRAALDEAGIDGAYPIVVPDLHRNALWVHHVETYVPPFDVVLTHNPLPARLFSEAGYEIDQPEMHERETYQGKQVRRLLLEDGEWDKLVPEAVADLIEDFDGPGRLRDVEGGSGGRSRPR